jgi:hypothetical protein
LLTGSILGEVKVALYAKFPRGPEHHIKSKIVSINTEIAIQFYIRCYRRATRPRQKMFLNSAKNVSFMQ